MKLTPFEEHLKQYALRILSSKNENISACSLTKEEAQKALDRLAEIEMLEEAEKI
jgi:hypothetical protein